MRSTVAAVVLATAVPALASPGHGYAVGSIQSRQAAENASLACCYAVQNAIPSAVKFPSNVDFTASVDSYWSLQQAELLPACVVQPTTPQQVSQAIVAMTASTDATVQYGKCQFAVRGGGHTPWAGSSSSNGSVTIDFTNMKNITVNGDQSTVSVGPGSRWMDVYAVLDPLHLSTPGGRVADVGVAGLTLGGGFSFFAPRYGFVCDNVVNFEVVQPNGNIVNANATSNPELWWGLKGGSNNFGIVTRFDFTVFQQDPFWGGNQYFPVEVAPPMLNALAEFTSNPNYDVFASLINSYAYESAIGAWTIANYVVYTKNANYSAAYQAFAGLPQLPSALINSTMRVSNMSDFANELRESNPAGKRQTFVTSTYNADAALLNQIFDICNNTLQSVKDAPGLVYALSLEPVPIAVTSKDNSSNPNGTTGNALGITAADGPQILALLSISWNNTADDARIAQASQSFIQTADAAAIKANQKNSTWIYLNYAAQWQDPLASYGAQNLRNLNDLQKIVDYGNVWQTQLPGGFKLSQQNGTATA